MNLKEVIVLGMGIGATVLTIAYVTYLLHRFRTKIWPQMKSELIHALKTNHCPLCHARIVYFVVKSTRDPNFPKEALACENTYNLNFKVRGKRNCSFAWTETGLLQYGTMCERKELTFEDLRKIPYEPVTRK
jgi:hypothetical protein